jgi:hypothetical protein
VWQGGNCGEGRPFLRAECAVGTHPYESLRRT